MAHPTLLASRVRPDAWRFLREYEKAAHVVSKEPESFTSSLASNVTSPWIVFFDFDRTLSQVHIFKTLSGWDLEVRPDDALRIDAPYALTERGQLRRLADLGPQWTRRAFGGDTRIAQLRHLLTELHGARLIIVTRGYVGVVRKCLEDVGLLQFFERVHGNVGEAYGKGTAFDFESNSCDLALDAKRFLGQPDEGNWGSKRAVVARYLADCEAGGTRALFIDDDENELKELQGLLSVILVHGDGISLQEEKKIFEKLRMSQRSSPPAAEKRQYEVGSVPRVHTSRPWWERICCFADDDDDQLESDWIEMSRGIKDKTKQKLARRRSDSRTPCVYDKSRRSFLGCATTLKKMRSVQIADQRVKNFEESYQSEKTPLGRGAFGTTYRATEKNAFGRTVVVKKMYNKGASQDCSEFLYLRQMTSPHVVRVFDCFTDASHQYIVMEYCAGGDLHHSIQTINDRGGKTSEWCAAIFQQVIAGVLYLHTQFHRQHNDLKPENILLERKPKHHLDVPRTMIADFGCVVNGTYGEKSEGDPRYSAFEVLSHGVISETSDAWSLGVTLYELLTGELPFVDHNSVGSWPQFKEYGNGSLMHKLKKAWAKMHSGQLREADCSKIEDPLGRELARALLQVDPEERISLLEARRHEFFNLAKGLLSEQKQCLSSAPIAAHLRAIQDFKLRLVLLALVTSKLQGEHLNYYANIFDEADEHHNGVLNLPSFAKLWASIDLPDGVHKPPAEEVFQTIDLDDNGQIDFDEFVTFAFDMDRLDTVTIRQCMRSAFASICGPDGKVEVRDFQGLFAHEALPVVSHLFQEIDTKCAGHIEYPAFKEYIKALQGNGTNSFGSLKRFSFKSVHEEIQKRMSDWSDCFV